MYLWFRKAWIPVNRKALQRIQLKISREFLEFLREFASIYQLSSWYRNMKHGYRASSVWLQVVEITSKSSTQKQLATGGVL